MSKALTVSSYALGATRGNIKTDSFISDVDGKKREWLEGAVLTPWGIVTVYSQGGEQSRPWSHYSVVTEGRVYYASEGVQRTKRGLAIVATRFARDVYAQAMV